MLLSGLAEETAVMAEVARSVGHVDVVGVTDVLVKGCPVGQHWWWMQVVVVEQVVRRDVAHTRVGTVHFVVDVSEENIILHYTSTT